MRPSGTVTFLFTDIEGSTQRWERDRDAMSAALARHDAILRNAIESGGGFLFKTVGDAFCAAFPTAPGALAAALAAQRALAAEDFAAAGGVPVRAALHAGVAEQRDGDYFGPAVNRVARLLAIGHGGQILVSRTAADLLHGEMPSDVSLRDLGAHLLRDLAHPERVYQVEATGLAAEFPALRSLGGLPNNLPAQLTSFVGRERDLAEIAALLRDHRLVTLVGSGGSGKTRCAIQSAAELLESFADGVWFVELAPLADASLVPAAVARVLGVRESPDVPLAQTLVAHLQRRQVLLVLDNCEHVIDAVREVVAAILRDCPGVRILATGREGLNIAGERAFRLPSLAEPAAVALFVDRARASHAAFALTGENAAHVAEIARRLDGIPLAIELAAARAKVLSPQQLVQRLDERFRVLTGGDRSALPRHQTMRALIDWSYDLLSERERAVFRALSVFAGGATLENAAEVCGGGDELETLDVLASLVDKSLVVADPAGDCRYRMLESTRQYAREKLVEHGELETTALAHARAFLALADRLERIYNRTPDAQWFALVEPELENWRAALDWTLGTRGDVLLGQRLAAALGRHFAFLLAAEGRRWILAAQASADDSTPPAVVAQLELAEAQIDAVLGLQEASYAAALRALGRYENLADAAGVAHARRHAGRGLIFLGRVEEGEALLRQAHAAFETLGDRILAAAALENLGIARNVLGDFDGARRLHGDALAIFKANGADRLAAALANNLAEAEFHAGEAEAALRLALDAIAMHGVASFTSRLGLMTCNVTAYLVALGRYDEARTSGREALAMARDAHHQVAVTWALQHLAAVAALDPHRAGDGRARAARLLGYVDERLAALGTRREYTEEREYGLVLAALREALGETALAECMGEGRSWSDERAVAEGKLA